MTTERSAFAASRGEKLPFPETALSGLTALHHRIASVPVPLQVDAAGPRFSDGRKNFSNLM
jgi:hypothetical protein